MVLTALTCLALNIYHEARSEPIDGQLMVAEVTLNRAKMKKYHGDICKVVYAHKQFSWTSDGKSDKPHEKKAWKESLSLAKNVLDDKSILLGTEATSYHAVYVTPYWAKSFVRIGQVGKHIFYKKK